MADKRMFAIKMIDSDVFLGLPPSTQALYFHLGMRADDDGFVSNPKRIAKMVGASDKDLSRLLDKRYLLSFKSGIVVIKHWKINNYIRKDRYTPTLYTDEFRTLYEKQDGTYTDHPPVDDQSPDGVQTVAGCQPLGIPDDNQKVTDAQPNGDIGKVRLDKVRLEEISTNNSISLSDEPDVSWMAAQIMKSREQSGTEMFDNDEKPDFVKKFEESRKRLKEE